MLVIDAAEPGGYLPSDYGRSDWHHNEMGQVDYPIYIDSNNPWEPTGCLDDFDIESQRWRPECSDEALDNLKYGRERRSYLRELFNAWDVWEREWN